LRQLSPKAALQESDAVFLGMVVSTREVDLTREGYRAAFGYTIRVSQAWKGVARGTVEVGTSSSGTACGYPFVLGEEYLIYAHSEEAADATRSLLGLVAADSRPRPRFWTSSCTRTKSFWIAEQEDLAELGEPSWGDETALASFLSDELLRASSSGDADGIRTLIRAGHDVNGRDRRYGLTALIAASSGGHLEAVRVLLAAGADVDAVKKGGTALLAAAAGGHVEVLRELLEAGAAADGNTLRVAASEGKLAVVNELLRSGVAADAEADIGYSPLAAAASQGHRTVVERLLAAGANPNRRSSGRTVLDLTVGRGDLELARLLLASGARIRPETLRLAVENAEMLALLERAGKGSGLVVDLSPEVLIRAASSRDTQVLAALLARNPDVNAAEADGDTPLIMAAFMGTHDSVKLLLDSGARVNQTNARGWTALMRASFRGDLPMMKLLLERGADVNAGAHEMSLIWAAENGHLDAVNLLLDAGADVKAEKGTPIRTALSAAVERREIEVAETLLKRGADVDAGHPLGIAAWRGDLALVTLLMDAGASLVRGQLPVLASAASSGRIEVVEALLARGARPLPPALHHAASEGVPEIVAALLKRGMDANVRDRHNYLMPLHFAAQNLRVDAVRLLLAAGAKVDARSKDGETPLMFSLRIPLRHLNAQASQRQEIIGMLLGAGADAGAKDNFGRTALSMAEGIGDEILVEMLRGKR
jgi:ankyrin repeat protein